MKKSTMVALGCGAGAITGIALAVHFWKRKQTGGAVACGVMGGCAAAVAAGAAVHSARKNGPLLLEYQRGQLPMITRVSNTRLAEKRGGSSAKRGGAEQVTALQYSESYGKGIAIAILKNSPSLSQNTKSIMSVDLIHNLYKAEAKRMHFLEKLGIDGASIGRGQVTERSYKDVIGAFGNEMNAYSAELNIEFSQNFKTDMGNPYLEDFIVIFYLALMIDQRQKDGRSAEDAAKFGIGYYHGARPSITQAQKQAEEELGYDKIPFDGTEVILRNGTPKQRDILNYIEEVFYGTE